jgi:hypothetical protein
VGQFTLPISRSAISQEKYPKTTQNPTMKLDTDQNIGYWRLLHSSYLLLPREKAESRLLLPKMIAALVKESHWRRCQNTYASSICFKADDQLCNLRPSKMISM